MTSVEVLAGCRVIVELPVAHLDDLIAAGELLIQEHLDCWTVPYGRRGELAGLREVFGRRVRLGVADLRCTGQIEHALAETPDLLLSPFGDAELVAAAAGTPLVLGGLTPSELSAALRLGTAAVQVLPCDALGSLYARTVTGMFTDEPLIATGRLERFQCELWLDAGAVAVSPSGAFSTDDVEDPDLTDLRRRAQGYNFG
jgi:2-dehydro-3-deoxyphosphogluconate aldolase/(4S)-4-hydroxy-2-oxoglutarate aldolase